MSSDPMEKVVQNECAARMAKWLDLIRMSLLRPQTTHLNYTECTLDYSTSPWCSTLTTEEGVHVSGHWGHCNMSSCQGDVDDGSPNDTLFSHTDHHDDALSDCVAIVAAEDSIADCWVCDYENTFCSRGECAKGYKRFNSSTGKCSVCQPGDIGWECLHYRLHDGEPPAPRQGLRRTLPLALGLALVTSPNPSTSPRPSLGLRRTLPLALGLVLVFFLALAIACRRCHLQRKAAQVELTTAAVATGPAGPHTHLPAAGDHVIGLVVQDGVELAPSDPSTIQARSAAAADDLDADPGTSARALAVSFSAPPAHSSTHGLEDQTHSTHNLLQRTVSSSQTLEDQTHSTHNLLQRTVSSSQTLEDQMHSTHNLLQWTVSSSQT
eukprot:g82288.t1